jgi:hypothetical protein
MKHSISARTALSLAILISVGLSATGAHALGLNDLNTSLNNTISNTSRQLQLSPGYASNLSQVTGIGNQGVQAQKLLNNAPQLGQDSVDQKGIVSLDASRSIQLKVNQQESGQTAGALDAAKAYEQVVNHTNRVAASGVAVQPDGSILLVKAGAQDNTGLRVYSSQPAIDLQTNVGGNLQAQTQTSQSNLPFHNIRTVPAQSTPQHQISDSTVQDQIKSVNTATSALVQKQQDQAVDAIHSNAFAVNRQTAPWGVNIVTTHNKLQETTGITPQSLPRVK